MRVVFFGTPLFAAEVLRYLLENKVNVVAVVSKPDRPKGRSSHPAQTPVKEIALSQNPPIPLFQPEAVSELEFAEVLSSFNADLFVVVAYGEILRQHLLDMPHVACINLHASLLPKFRGAAPIQRCIIEGEKESGITLMHMVRKMDAGDMLDEVRVPISSEMTFGELEEKLCGVGKEALLKLIVQYENHEEPLCVVQDHAKATFAPKIELEDCEIQWGRRAQELHDLVRGVNPYPGAWCYVNIKGEKKRLKINKTLIVSCEKSLPGTVLNRHLHKGNLLIATGDLALELLEIQLEGKKPMTSEELCRGVSRLQIDFIVY